MYVLVQSLLRRAVYTGELLILRSLTSATPVMRYAAFCTSCVVLCSAQLYVAPCCPVLRIVAPCSVVRCCAALYVAPCCPVLRLVAPCSVARCCATIYVAPSVALELTFVSNGFLELSLSRSSLQVVAVYSEFCDSL
jgi:hypothetical protein